LRRQVLGVDSVLNEEVVALLLIKYVEEHAQELLNLLLQKTVVVYRCLVAEQRHNDCRLKLPEAVLDLSQVLEKGSVKVKHVNCKLGVAAI